MSYYFRFPELAPSRPAASRQPATPSRQPTARTLEEVLREWIAGRKGSLYSGWLRLRILELAGELGGAVSTGEVLEALQSELPEVKLQAVSKMLKKMWEEGLLARRNYGGAPKFTHYVLTKRGQALLEKVKERKKRVENERQLKSLLLYVLREAQRAKMEKEAAKMARESVKTDTASRLQPP